MAYLNKEERDKLANQLKDKTRQQVRGHVNRMDKDARLAYFRNVQEPGKWMTRYVLPTYGIMVTVVEKFKEANGSNKLRREFVIDHIEVAPTADNRT